jgi:glycosyltransferase involved in cell wall biosynthesis
MNSISIIIPVYGCENCLRELNARIISSIKDLADDFEIIYVDDCSPDDAWSTIQVLSKTDTRIKAIKLSRNFGQHHAITAGLEKAIGDWMVVMDCDLQDCPEEIPKLFKKALEGYDIVYGQRILRQDNLFKRLFSKWFYSILGYLTDTKQDSTIANFGIYNKKVIQAILSMKDYIRYLPAMVRWVGFNYTAIEVKHAERAVGKTSYNIRKLIRLGTNVVLSFSEKPLHLVIRFGFLITLISFIFGVYYLIRFFAGKITVMGFTSLIISVWFLSGIIILILGIIGLYIGKTFERAKERPLYIIDKTTNL